RGALDKLHSYRDTVLRAAVTGELTAYWRTTHLPEETSEQLLIRLLVERRNRWEEAELIRLRDAAKSPNDNKWTRRYREPQSPKAHEFSEIPRDWVVASIDQLAWSS